MREVRQRLHEFVKFTKGLKGDEKGEAQVFCDRLFQAFGHKGVMEAGGELEARVRKHSTNTTSFADLLWKPHLLLEMKKRGENLFHHFQQAFDYWVHAVPDRPRYVILCNFDEFRIFDFDKQIDQPVDTVRIEDLTQRYTALNFLFPNTPPNQFLAMIERQYPGTPQQKLQVFFIHLLLVTYLVARRNDLYCRSLFRCLQKISVCFPKV